MFEQIRDSGFTVLLPATTSTVEQGPTSALAAELPDGCAWVAPNVRAVLAAHAALQSRWVSQLRPRISRAILREPLPQRCAPRGKWRGPNQPRRLGIADPYRPPG